MKIETPQILWHNGENGKPAPLYSASLLQTQDTINGNCTQEMNILATAGNSEELHIWKIKLDASHDSQPENPPARKKSKIFSVTNTPNIQHLTTLTRHTQSINSIAFSPNGNHLASAGDQGTLMIHTIPSPYFDNESESQHDPHEFWHKKFTQESDLSLKMISSKAQDIMDISWSKSSDKFMIGTVDHSVIIYQQVFAREGDKVIVKDWKEIYRNATEHRNYVQGVSFDPLGVYFASQGSDRTVKVWSRKNKTLKEEKRVLMDQDNNTDENKKEEIESFDHDSNWKTFDVVSKAKTLKYRSMNTESTCDESSEEEKEIKRHLFADESTLESFFRRLSWTVDGAFLITPASLYHDPSTSDSSGPSYATYLFARHQYERPYKVLHGLEKPSVVIRANPVLFQLPHCVNLQKENANPSVSPSSVTSSPDVRGGLGYRSLFAVLTIDSVLIYDTFHSAPLCIAKNLHYASLTDCSWSADGHHLIVTSTDGYISMISFDQGELGEVFHTSVSVGRLTEEQCKIVSTPIKNDPKVVVEKVKVIIPPCEPGTSSIVAPPSKKARVSFDETATSTDTTDVAKQINTLVIRKKKKRATLTPVTIDLQGEVDKEVVGAVTSLSIENSSIPQSS